MKVAFALIPEKGHVNPYIGPAQALAGAGHEVVFAAAADIGEQIERAGLTFRHDLIRAGADDRVTSGRELVELIQDPLRLDAWIEQLLLGGAEDSACAVLDWYRREHADVVVVDPLFYSAAIAAHLARLPWASVSNSLNPVVPPDFDSALTRTIRRLTPRRAELFRRFGMDAAFSVADVLSPYLTVAFATEALAGKPPTGVTLVGPSFPLRARGDEAPLRPLPTDRPVIYASFGSQIYYFPDVFEKVIAASSRLNAHVVLSIGDLIDQPRWSAPIAHCDVYRYAPQLDILGQASVFITHGGANSVMEAIACGVPMLVSPMCNDQFQQAYFVERAGIGCTENLVEAPVERIADRLRYLFSDRGIGSAMNAVSATYQTNGSETTARLIAALGAHK